MFRSPKIFTGQRHCAEKPSDHLLGNTDTLNRTENLTESYDQAQKFLSKKKREVITGVRGSC